MRLELVAPKDLNGEQKELYASMDKALSEKLKGFVARRDDGALAGPFNAMLRFPQFGKAAWEFTTALIEHSTLPRSPHEVAILVTGAALKTRYEIYAHERVAAAAGLSASKIATIVAGNRPGDLSEEEGVAYDVATVLVHGGQLPQMTYEAAVRAFGEDGMAELAYLVGGYCLVSALLNAYDVSVPGREEGLPQG